MIVDLDRMLALAPCDKQDANATWKRTYEHHPLTGFVDRGRGGTGESVAALLRPGNGAATPPPTTPSPTGFTRLS
ncbi:hypothetical protein [Streptomyces cyaneofuscatus]|uniref:hypothetical protein n=1 Tax=Streptomyces cyaneofuscatus TaxID=66883 RepID=UPI0036A91186